MTTLFKNIYLLIIIILITVLGFGFYLYNNSQEKIELITKDNIVCELQKESFILAIEQQNQRINEFIKLSDIQKDKITLSEEEINIIKDTYSKRLNKLQKQNTGSTCNETIEWMIKKAQQELR